MISKAFLLSCGHIALFLLFYVFGLFPEHNLKLAVIKIIWFFVFSVTFLRSFFEVPKLSHSTNILSLLAIVTLSTVVCTGFDFYFNNFYDDQIRYERARNEIEQINARRDRRNLPHEVFDKAKVDANYHPKMYLQRIVHTSVFNIIVVLFVYLFGIFYWKIRQE